MLLEKWFHQIGMNLDQYKKERTIFCVFFTTISESF